MMLVLIALLSGLAFVASSPVIIWNSKQTTLDDALKNMPPDSVLLSFVLPELDMGRFNQLANVYNAGSDGGRLKKLKSFMESSIGYGLTDAEDPLSRLNQMKESHSSDEVVEIRNLGDVQRISPKTALVDIFVPTLADLELLVPKVVEKLKGRNYVAVLLGERHEAPHLLKKRAATADEPPSFIMAGKDGCRLYAKSVTLYINDDTYVVWPGTVTTEADTKCNSSDSARLKFSIAPKAQEASQGLRATSKLTLDFHFSSVNLKYWTLALLLVTADTANQKGSKDGNVNVQDLPVVSRTKVGASQTWSFACMKPKAFVTNATKDSKGVTVAVKFDSLQIQPFGMTADNKFSVDVDDCVPFFSPGILMGIISMLILILVFAFGISMIANLKTMDKFDDPRGKPLQINAKE